MILRAIKDRIDHAIKREWDDTTEVIVKNILSISPEKIHDLP